MLTNISGFPEFLPRDQLAFNKVLELIKTQFELYGFIPLDTPAVERVSTLISKGNDNEIYAIHRLAHAHGCKKKDLALRFDLTVPLARYVAQHYGQLTFPYRRYHIAPVWRGERAQSGRYRQFYQCDIDVIGDGELSLAYDAETLSIIYHVFKTIGIKNFVIYTNHYLLLTGLIKSFDIQESLIPCVMRTLDKAEKISQDALVGELKGHGMNQNNIDVLTCLIKNSLTNEELFQYLLGICSNTDFLKGVCELKEVLKLLQNFGVKDSYIRIHPTLARGLNYYTGTIAETKLLDFPELGSVCGGGRYADLAGSFSNKTLPGVGFSIGISRLIPKLIQSGMICANQETPAIVLITVQNYKFISYYIEISKTLRTQGINTEIYLEQKSLGSQLKYAHKKGIRFVIIANESEIFKQQIILRSLFDGNQWTLTMHQAIKLIKDASEF
ncbi:histidine--tRNA ligase [Holospora obtusa]|nr:histidine--tRNA ligase [Holospora obtusa]